MKHKTIILPSILLIVFIIAITTIACNSLLSFDERTEICEGFSNELISTLASRYQMTIPQDATFVKGINTNTIRDPMVVILFECPLNENQSMDDSNGCSYVFRVLKLDESRYSFGGHDEKIPAEWFDEFGGTLDYKIVDNNDPFTFISYSFSGKVLTIRFVGRHPGKTFD